MAFKSLRFFAILKREKGHLPMSIISPRRQHVGQPTETELSRVRRLEMQHLQAIEGNPLTDADVAMFEMFECEGWSHQQRRAHILAAIKHSASPEAAE